MTVLKGGLSPSKLYKINTADHPYVLRLIDPRRDFADRDREIKCMAIASRESIAPQVYYANTQDGIILMEYFKDQPLSDKVRDRKILLPLLSDALKKLHNGPPFPKTISRIQEIRNVGAKIQLPELVQEALALLEKADGPLQKTVTLRPCHNDLNPNNILFSGKEIRIIDWEGSGMGDPFFDLAAVVLFLFSEPKEEDLFLKSYFGKAPTQAQKNRFFVIKQVALCFYGISLLQASSGETSLPPLSSDEIDALPSFTSFLNAIGEGKEKLSSPRTLQKFAFTAFKQACHNMKKKEFAEALAHIQ